ncbi:hypothetical protein E4U15_005582 [Claviceps sp. LM218 group G6]|nr:hypothetical protein E4U15_005582 [Claviceps sp. LM218 group G6]
MSAVCLSSVAGTQVRSRSSFQRSSVKVKDTSSPFESQSLANGSETEQHHTGSVELVGIGGGLEVLQDFMNQYDRKMNMLNTHHACWFASRRTYCRVWRLPNAHCNPDYLAKRSRIQPFELWESY